MAVKAERRVNSMRKYPKQFYDHYGHLAHKGTKGMKWGYTDGVKNGKRTANEEDEEDEKNKFGLEKDFPYQEIDGVPVRTASFADGKRNNYVTNSEAEWRSSGRADKYISKKESKNKRGKLDRFIDSGRRLIDDFFKRFS